MTLHLRRRRPALKAEADGESVIVRLVGEGVWLNEEAVPVLSARLDGLAAEWKRRRLVLDFENVELVSSTALGALLRLRKQVQAAGGRVALRNLQDAVHEVFEVTHLAGLFEIEHGVGTAAQELPDGEWPPGAILVVDDEECLRSLLERVFRQRGFAVFLAATGKEALACYERAPEAVAVVLLDVRLPGWSGPETLAALRRVNAWVCGCFMSGNPGRYTEEDLFRLGAADVFEKPFSLDDLVEVVLHLAERPVSVTPGRP
jgi:anti-anti-sigma factor